MEGEGGYITHSTRDTTVAHLLWGRAWLVWSNSCSNISSPHRTGKRNGNMNDIWNGNVLAHVSVYMYDDQHTRWGFVNQRGILVTSDLHKIAKPFSEKREERQK